MTINLHKFAVNILIYSQNKINFLTKMVQEKTVKTLLKSKLCIYIYNFKYNAVQADRQKS